MPIQIILSRFARWGARWIKSNIQNPIQYIAAQLQQFNSANLWSRRSALEGMRILLGWAVPSFSFVLAVDRFHEHVPSVYLQAAISEGIGPHLWNVIGTLGLVLFGLALLFPRVHFIARSAHQVLINTFAIGGLSFGLLFGQLATALVSATANIATWKAWLIGAGGLFLAIQVLALNFSLWYFSQLMASREEADHFLHQVERVALRLRVAAFLVISVTPLVLLFMED